MNIITFNDYFNFSKYNVANLFLIFFIFTNNSFGQNAITFDIEELSKPKDKLFVKECDQIFKSLILQDSKLTENDIKNKNIDFKYQIIAKSKVSNKLVNFGYNSFFKGLFEAYTDHRPFVLSPDIIWLLISQGFSTHINSNPEKYRNLFVNFSGKVSLIVESEKDLLKDSVNWEDFFPKFTEQISKYTNAELINTLTSNFTTTTSVEKIASEITIMNSMKSYFEFAMFYAGCGIPKITLQGTTQDWENILKKINNLSKYDLNWWTKELEPIIEEFINASKGKIDKTFWRNMFKYHSEKEYAAPKIIDGWIIKFFPYDKDGKRNNLKEIIGTDNLPEEIVKVDVKYIRSNGAKIIDETFLEFWAGFIGLEQDNNNFTLTPKIGWMIKIKDKEQDGILKKFELENTPFRNSGIEIIVNEVPDNLRELKEIFTLILIFKENVFLPEWLKTKKIGKLFIEGKISEVETEKIIDWFPNTDLNINRKEYNFGKNNWVYFYGSRVSDDILKLNEIWVLEIDNRDFFGDSLVVIDELKNIKIENLSINETSQENIKKLIAFLPKTNIWVDGIRVYKP